MEQLVTLQQPPILPVKEEQKTEVADPKIEKNEDVPKSQDDKPASEKPEKKYEATDALAKEKNASDTAKKSDDYSIDEDMEEEIKEDQTQEKVKPEDSKNPEELKVDPEQEKLAQEKAAQE